MADDDYTTRKSPPEEHEWPHIWRGIDRAHKSWLITGPLYAAVTNWKAWAIIAAIVAAFNSPEIASIVQIVRGMQ